MFASLKRSFFINCVTKLIISPLFSFRLQLGFERNHHRNVSLLLDNLLKGYDNSVRPGFWGELTYFFWLLLQQVYCIVGRVGKRLQPINGCGAKTA